MDAEQGPDPKLVLILHNIYEDPDPYQNDFLPLSSFSKYRTDILLNTDNVLNKRQKNKYSKGTIIDALLYILYILWIFVITGRAFL